MDAVELLRKLVSIDSVYPNEREIAEFVEERLKESGFEVRRDYVGEERFNVLAERNPMHETRDSKPGTGNRTLLFYGHLDTVPACDGWTGDPLVLRLEGDRLTGLGSWDMKAGIAAILKAVEAPDGRRIKVAFGVDEENVSEGAQGIAGSGFLDDVEGVVVAEAGNSHGEHPGPRMITLGRRGRAVYRIEIIGRSAHGATGRGISAAEIASRVVLGLGSRVLRRHELLPQANQFVRSIHSDSEGLSVPEHAVIELDRHLVPPETFESVREELDGEMDEFRSEGVQITVRLKERETPYLAPYVTDQRNDFVGRVCGSVKAHYGEDPVFNFGLSVADENVFAALGLPVVTIGPSGSDDHSPNEWVSKKSFLELVEVYKRIVQSV